MNRKTYQYWPIRIRIVKRTRLTGNSWFTWHGWQTGWKGTGHGVFGWTFHLGRLLFLFGDQYSASSFAHPKFSSGGREWA